jgi:hypothetical protein
LENEISHNLKYFYDGFIMSEAAPLDFVPDFYIRGQQNCGTGFYFCHEVDSI